MAHRRNPNILHFKGSNFMRQRLVLSVLTGKTISINDIRPNDNEPGLREYEVNLLRLMDKMTNGTYLEVNETGTSFVFTPGALSGGQVSHDCCKLRGIGYYLEVVVALAPFCKKPLDIDMKGVTNNETDPSVDSFQHGGLNVLKSFIVIDPGIEFKIKKRGLEPNGGGEIHFRCPVVKLKAVQLRNCGKIKKIRGTAYAARVSPALANRLIETAKGVLIKFLPDVFISCDLMKGPSGGLSPGFGGCLVAETTTGVKLTADVTSRPPPGSRQSPEDLGDEAAKLLLEGICRGGTVDSSFQALAFLYAAFTSTDVSQMVLGPLSPYAIEFLRNLKIFTGLMVKLEPFVEESNDDEDDKMQLGDSKILVTSVGSGYHRFN